MKKIFALLVVLFASIGLYGCGEDPEDDVTIPSFDYFTINEDEPSDETIYAEKNELLRLDIFIDNPSDLEINSIRINGTTYRQSRFEAESTNEHVIFNFDVLRVPGHNDYELEAIEYTHEGVQTLLINDNNTWNAYVLENIPTASLDNIITDQESLNVSVNLSDNDGTIDEAVLELFKDGSIVDSVDITAGIAAQTFTDLYSDNDYTLRLVVSYERGDGHEYVEDEVLAEVSEIRTSAKALPQLSIDNIVADKTSVSFSYDVVDGDNVGSISSIMLYHDDEFIEEIDMLDSLVFSDLLSNVEYSIVIEYTYDLNDQAGSQTLTTTENFTTEALESPSVSIENIREDHESVLFDISLQDDDEVISADYLSVLIKDDNGFSEEKLVDIDALSDIHFDNLLSNTTYTIEVRGSYDLNDSQGSRDDVLLHSETFTTAQTEIPEMESTLVSSSETELVIDIDASSFDDIREGEQIKISIYNETTDEFIKTYSIIDSTERINIKDLLSNQTIRIEVEATFNLRDGEGQQTAIVHTNTFTTTTTNAPSGSVSNVETSQEGVSFNYSFSDSSNTKVEGSLIAILYEDQGDGSGYTIVDTQAIDPASSSFMFDYASYYDRAYSVELFVDYDLRDGEGIHSDHRLDNAFKSIRLAPKAPVGSIETEAVTHDSFTLEYLILDIDGTINEDGITLTIDGETYTSNTLDGAFTVTDLLSDTTYEYVLSIEYIRGSQSYTLEFDGSFTTDALEDASGEIVESDRALGEITVDVSFEDPDSTFTEDDLSLVLYDSDDEVVGDPLLISELGSYTFDELKNNTDYTLRLYATVDKNDGAGPQEVLLDSYSFTSINGDIDVSIEDSEINQETMHLRIDYTDEYGISELPLKIVVYDQEDNPINTYRIYDGPTSVQISELYSNYTYTINVYGDVDYQDGSGVVEDVLLHSESYTTEAKAQPIPEMTIENIEVNTSISVSLGEFEDIDEVYSSMTLYLYELNEDGTYAPIDDIAIDLNDVESTYTFDHTHDETSTYRIQLRADYDLNDSNTYEDEILISESVVTIRP